MNAVDRAEALCEDVGLGEQATKEAVGYAERSVIEHPINRTSRVVAAGAVYLGAKMNPGEYVTQEVVSDHGDVSIASIRDAYLEIAEHEGLRNQVQPDNESEPPFVNRLIEKIRKYLK